MMTRLEKQGFRIMFRTLFILLVMACFGGVCVAGSATECAKSVYYTVKTGDTLWDISQDFYGNPLYWPIIWDSNRVQVSNPHRIYPGESLLIPHPSVVSLVKQTAHQNRKELKTIEPEKKRVPKVTSEFILFSPFISPEPISSPYILGGSVYDPERSVFDLHDKVLIHWAPGAPPPCGKFLAARNEGEVLGSDGKFLGWRVMNLAIVRVTKVGADVAQGVIESMAFSTHEGDYLFPLKFPPPVYKVIPGPSQKRGMIVKLQEHKDVGGLMDFVFVNLGDCDGVEPGMVLDVYNKRGVEEVAGKLLVVRTLQNSATCYIVKSRIPLEIGMEVRGGNP